MLSFKTLAVLAALTLGAVARPADMAARDEAPTTTPSTEKITFAMAAPGLETARLVVFASRFGVESLSFLFKD
ncbi:hypothetical protein VDGE_20476 [Verticillium dahliae]|uniref:Uncharacterized protein n=1 Tax=Verticillium dahliae TaxID=27337 RepID=A0A444RTS6_VERDA|nr:hypothetical protein VDGE_20476 [Verticillium dahliae]